MKYVISWENRANATEESVARALQVFSKWQPADGVTFHQFLGRVDGTVWTSVVPLVLRHIRESRTTLVFVDDDGASIHPESVRVVFERLHQAPQPILIRNAVGVGVGDDLAVAGVAHAERREAAGHVRHVVGEVVVRGHVVAALYPDLVDGGMKRDRPEARRGAREGGEADVLVPADGGGRRGGPEEKDEGGEDRRSTVECGTGHESMLGSVGSLG